jgi:HD-like signal output (HDOD) protein
MGQGILETTEKLMQGIGIPSQPHVLVEINKEVSKEEPNFSVISDLVSSDVALSARIIKVCNSPFFGLRQKVDSINRALTVLGLKNFKNVVLASALSDNMNSPNISAKDFEYFCNHSLFIAKIAQAIAHRLPVEIKKQVDPDHAYMAGLFHDCAIPLLTKKHKDYFVTVAEALKSNVSMVEVEENAYQTNHCLAAYFVAKSWYLPENVCLAIMNHHHPDISAVDDLGARRLLAVLILAESIIYYKDNNMTYIFDIFNYNVGEGNYGKLQFELDFTNDDISDIEDSVANILDMTV